MFVTYNEIVEHFLFMDEKTGTLFFRITMSRDKSTDISKFIRFNKKKTNDPKDYIQIILRWYPKTHGNISIDEQLFPTKALCGFTH